MLNKSGLNISFYSTNELCSTVEHVLHECQVFIFKLTIKVHIWHIPKQLSIVYFYLILLLTYLLHTLFDMGLTTRYSHVMKVLH